MDIALAVALSASATLPVSGCARAEAVTTADPVSLRANADTPDIDVANRTTLAQAVVDSPVPMTARLDEASLPLTSAAKTGMGPADGLVRSLDVDTPSQYPTEPVLVPVPGDAPVLVVHAAPETRRAIVYMHGRCGSVHSMEPWAQVAAHYGTVVALRGDRRCAQGFYWDYSIPRIHGRIQAALKAVANARDGNLDASQVTLIGYSEGASRAELLPHRYPRRYPWVVLAGAPEAPKTWRLKSTRAVVLLGGEYERSDHLRHAHRRLLAAGLLAAYIELPRTHHGSFGPEGDRVMAEALWWMYDRAP